MPQTDNKAKYIPASLFISPTLVIGLGGSGTEVVRLVKSRIRRAMGTMPEIVDFLALDTEPCNNPPGLERIFAREFGYLGDYNASDVMEHLDRHPHIQDWWPANETRVSGTIHKGARQRRIVGRLSLYARWGEFAIPLDRKIDRIRDIANKEQLQKRGVEVERATGQVQVYIIGSLCGGTGAGIFLDVAFRVRKVLKDDADIVGVFLLPSCFLQLVQSRIQKQRIQANAAASLLELNYFMEGNPFDSCFPDQPFRDRQGEKNVFPLYRPFDSVYLVDRSNGKELLDGVDEIQKMTAQQVFLDMVTPLGKRYAARRANLRDLAGEQGSGTTGNNNSGHDEMNLDPNMSDGDIASVTKLDGNDPPKSGGEPLFVAGFCTASLILPLAEAVQSAQGLAAAQFIQMEILGRNPDGEMARSLKQEVETRFKQLRNQLRFERVQVSVPSEPTAGEEVDPAAALLGLNSGSGTPSRATSATTIDLTNAENDIQVAFEDLRAFLQRAYDERHLGLAGVRFLVDTALSQSQNHRATLGDETARLARRHEDEEKAIGDRPEPSRGDRLLGPINALLGQPSPHEQRVQSWQTNAQAHRAATIEIETQQNRNRMAIEATDRLSNALQEIRAQLDQRIEGVKRLVEELRRIPERRQDDDGVPQDQRIEIFELATPVGWEIHDRDGQGAVSFLKSQREQLADAIARLGSQELDTLTKQLQDAGLTFCWIKLDPNGRGGRDLHLVEQMPSAEDTLRRVTTLYFAARASTLGADKLGTRIVDYLKWFYESIPYGTGTQRTTYSSRYTPIDPLHMLNSRMRRIFLDTDETALGSESSANTEPVHMIGSDRDRDQDTLVRDLLEDFDRWENVATATPDRIDASFSRHGFSVRALRQRRDFREAYQYFTATLREKIHLHRDWDESTFNIGILS